MEAQPAYAIRHDVLEPARTLRLAAEGLAIEDGDGRSTLLPYREIVRVRLRYFPTRVQTNRFECLVTTRLRDLKFSNEFYRGIARFDDRSAEYRRFVTAICQRLAAENPGIEFLTGRNTGSLVAEYGFLALMALLLGWILWITDSPLGWLIWVKLGLLVFFLPTLIRYVRRSQPARFDPQHIPERVLPQVGSG